MTSQLILENITVAYGEKTVLENLNINIDEGEFVGIIGPNGTGKSTLIKAITDIIEVKDGNIILNGKNNVKIGRKERARLVAVVPQEFNTDFEFKAFDIVMMGRNPHVGKGRKDSLRDYDIVYEAMIMTNTWQFKERYFNQLSGGERQRVIIARAIAQQTRIILLDEPTSHLDIHHQLEVLELVKMLNKKKKTTILAVLHDINMAARFSDRLILLNDGKIMADGSPDKVVDEKFLGKVYEMEMVIRKNKMLSTKEVVPIRVIKSKAKIKSTHVHVICGGGSGEQILESLKSNGFEVSCGVLNKGDSDWEICKMIDIYCVECKPFSEIDQGSHLKNIEMIKKSDCILVTDVPFGLGNLKNLEALLESDNPIYMIKRQGQFDYTEGIAEELLNKIEKLKGINYIKGYQEFLDAMKKGE